MALKAETTGNITDIQHFSIHDGPGIRTTVFFKGCSMHCQWCHNPENINPFPEKMFYKPAGICAAIGKTMGIAEVMQDIRKDMIFYLDTGGGATFSGGEPTMQLAFLNELASACKKEGIHTAIESNLLIEWKHLDELDNWINLFICDVKLIDDAKHLQFTGAGNSLILQNIRRLYQQGCSMIVRIPLINGVNNSDADIRDFGRFLSKLKPREGFKVEVLPYHKLGESKYEALGREYTIRNGTVMQSTIDRLMGILKTQGFDCAVNAW